MVYNDASGGQGIVQEIYNETGTDSASFAIADITRKVNIVCQELGLLAWKTQNSWAYDDSSHTDLPIAVTNMVEGQEDYTLPTTAFDIDRVEVKTKDGIWYKLTQLTRDQIDIAYEEFMKVPGIPAYFILDGDVITLKSAPSANSVTLTGGLKIYTSRDTTAFTVDDTTKTPGFPTALQPLIAYKVALDYCAKHVSDRVQYLSSQVTKYEGLFVNYYASRGNQRKSFKPQTENYS